MGLLCQRLDYSCENLVFTLKFVGEERRRREEGGEAEQTKKLLPLPPLIRTSVLNMKKYKFKVMSQQFSS